MVCLNYFVASAFRLFMLIIASSESLRAALNDTVSCVAVFRLLYSILDRVHPRLTTALFSPFSRFYQSITTVFFLLTVPLSS